MVVNHGRSQCHHVRVLAATGANLVGGFVCCKVFVRLDGAFGDTIPGRDDDARATRETKPVIVNVAEVFRDVFVQGAAGYGLRHASLFDVVQTANINRQDDVRRGVRAFALEPFYQPFWRRPC